MTEAHKFTGPFAITGLDKANHTVFQTVDTVEEARAEAKRMSDEGASVYWDEARHISGSDDGCPY
jgi:hypothetical protein